MRAAFFLFTIELAAMASPPSVNSLSCSGSMNTDISNHRLAHLRELTDRIYAALAGSS